MRAPLAVLLTLALLSAGVLLFPEPASAGTPPPNFADTLVTAGLNTPMSLAFLPDGSGRIVVVQQGGGILAWNGTALSTLHTMTEVLSGGEQGLLGVAVDPDWPARPYLYVFYTSNTVPSYQQVARFNLTDPGGVLTLDPLSKVLLLDDMPNNASNHNGGTLRFGPDKTLYLSVGDDATPCNAQDLTVLAGKILRIRVDDTIDPTNRSTLVPADNPWANASDGNQRLVWAWGLRNPFRFDVDPVTSRVFIGDVGQSTWEEVSVANASGLNFGWPYFEGEAVYQASLCPGQASIPPWVGPIHVYPNGLGSASVIGTTVYRGVNFPFDASFPPEYEANFLFFEFYQGFLRVLREDVANGTFPVVPGQTPTDWGVSYAFVPDMVRGPDGALYFLQNNGIRQLAYVNTNQPPVAQLTLSATWVNPGVPIDFDGSPSTDPDGFIVSYAWDFGDNTTGSGALVSHAWSLPGPYTITLTVVDNGSMTDSTAVNITVNAPPVAAISASANLVNPGVAVDFDGRGSSGMYDGIVSYAWDFGDTLTGSGDQVSHAYAGPGSYTVTLNVTDTLGLTDEETTSIQVNAPPVATFTASPQPANPGVNVSFDATASTDPDANLASYDWEFGDTATASGVAALHAYTAAGNYTANLTVTDAMGLSSTTSQVVSIVLGPNLLPIASLTATPSSVLLGQATALDASGSTDPDGVILAYAWDFGDGNTTAGTTATWDYVFTASGSYTVTVTVTDDRGGQSSASRIVSVNAPPHADAWANPSTGSLLTPFEFSANVSWDLDGTIVDYAWDFGDGTMESGILVTHNFTTKGLHTVTITVTDNDGAEDSDTVVVEVLNLLPTPVIVAGRLSGTVDDVFSFDGNSSNDPDGTVASYSWGFDDGTFGSGVTVTHEYARRGIYLVSLNVTDDDGARSTATLEVTVVNRAPVITATDPAGTTFTDVFDYQREWTATATDADGDAVTYVWTADGEVIGTGPSVFYGPLEVGTHTLTVTVSDGNQTDTHTWTVVNEPMIGTPTTPLLWWVPALFVGIAVLVALVILLVLVFGRRRRPPPDAVMMPPISFPPPMPPPTQPPVWPPAPGGEEPPGW